MKIPSKSEFGLIFRPLRKESMSFLVGLWRAPSIKILQTAYDLWQRYTTSRCVAFVAYPRKRPIFVVRVARLQSEVRTNDFY